MDSRVDRPEILDAMEQDLGVSTRYSPTLAKATHVRGGAAQEEQPDNGLCARSDSGGFR